MAVKEATGKRGSRDEPQVEMIPLKRLRESSINPRTRWGDLDDLARSIKAQGIIEPIIVRPRPDVDIKVLLNKEPDYEIVCGARRYRAAKLAKIDHIPAIVREMTDNQAIACQISENDQRDDFHPLDKAWMYKTAIDRGWSVESLAADTGRDKSYIYRLLKLNDLVETARQAFTEGWIQMGHALAIARMSAAHQEQLVKHDLARRVDGDGRAIMTVAQLTQLIQADYMTDLNAAAFPKDDLDLVILAGACTTCPKRTGYEPALWPEMSDRDMCTDLACFKIKARAWADRRQQQLRDSGKPAVKVSTGYGGRGVPGDVLTQQLYREISPAEARTLPADQVKTGVTVDGPQPGREVLVHVPLDAGRGTKGRDPETNGPAGETDQDEEARKEVLAMQRQNAVNKALFLAVAERVETLRASDWLEIATGMWDQLSMEACLLVCEVYGWKYDDSEHGWNPFDIPTARWKEPVAKPGKWKDDAWQKLCRVLLLAERSINYAPASNAPKQLLAVADSLGVDVAAVKKQAIAEFKATEKGSAGK